MWRVLLTFSVHRLLLLLVALMTINFSAPRPNSLAHSSVFLSWSELWGGVLQKTESSAEGEAFARVSSYSIWETVKADPNPFIWTARIVKGFLPFSSAAILILLGNLFFLWFLSELYALFNRMTTQDVAETATLLAALWVTTYELSLGASYSIPGLCAVAATKHALDNRWLLVGIFAAFLASFGAVSIPILILLVVVFAYFQRHFFLAQIIKRAVFFLIPVGLMVWWRGPGWLAMAGGAADSPLMQLFLAARGSFPISTFFAHAYIAQTLTILFFAVGLFTSIPGNMMWIHRAIPFFFFVSWILYGSFESIASRAIFAGVCMQGYGVVSSPTVARLLLVGLGVLSLYDCFRLFSAV